VAVPPTAATQPPDRADAHAVQVFAAEVEAALLSHPAVAQVRAPARPRAVASGAPQRRLTEGGARRGAAGCGVRRA